MNNIHLSIIIPCYNHGKYIKECVESILKVNYTFEIEIIIINDGSNDNGYTKTEIDKLVHPKVKIVHQTNQGLAKTRNNAINISTGNYILPIDADNYLIGAFVNNAVKLLDENEEIDIIYPDRIYLFENGKKSIFSSGDFSEKKLILGNYIDACAVFRKKVWEKLMGYDENMPIMGFEDWDFWLRASNQQFKFYYLKNNFFVYRYLENSMLKSTLIKYDEITPYVIKKNPEIFSRNLRKYQKQLSYLQRKPLRYLLKILFTNTYK